MEESLKNKTLSSLVWQFYQKIFGQLFSFIVTVILARMLRPEDYGVVALASMFNVLVGIFISGSMDAALIQKKDADELDYNTVFFSSLFMSIIIYGVVYFGAPIFASIYDNDLITPVMRVLALTMPIGSLAMVQNATISRNLEFKNFFFATLIGQIVAAIVGIVMAYRGYGPWALVAQSMIGTITNTIVMFFLVSWHPKLMFSWERFRRLFDYAWKKCLANFIGTSCNQLKGYLIGFKYSASDLAYYNRGEGLPEMIKNNIAGTMDAVLFPSFSKMQNDRSAMKRGMFRSITISIYIVVPLLMGLAAAAEQIVPLLYSEKWIPAIPFLQISCFTFIVVLLNNANLQVLYALGETETVLKQEFIKKPIMIAILAVAVFISPRAIVIGTFIHFCHEFFWTAQANKYTIDYSFCEQIHDVMPCFLLGLSMAALVYGLGMFISSPIIALSVQVVIGAAYYIGMSHMANFESYRYLKTIVIEEIRKIQ